MVTDPMYLEDSYLSVFNANVVDVDGDRVALDRTAFYPGGGGQPSDRGTLAPITQSPSEGPLLVIDVTGDGDRIWHVVSAPGLEVGDAVEGRLDWERRYQCMRTHTGVHALTAVIHERWGAPVTGGNMEPLAARIDFDFADLPDDFREDVKTLVNEALARDFPVRVSQVSAEVALRDPDLIRTKTNLVPPGLATVRVVEIVGLDRQADGGTHVRSTREVGTMSVTKIESKGRGNRRLRIRFE